MLYRFFLFFSLVFSLSGHSALSEIRYIPSPEGKTAEFVIVVDSANFGMLKDEIISYRHAVESEGMSTGIMIISGETPAGIRTFLKKYYQDHPEFKGIVLVGDIPIPMIRDAQHLTTAYKIDQRRFSFAETSVPSDRFYEDYDLDFNYLCKDSLNPLLYYYSLGCNSSQIIEKDIFSGRIFPPLGMDNRQEALRRFLIKIVEAHKSRRSLGRMLVFTGHGYHSESLASWEGEALMFREQFPYLYNPPGRVIRLYHSMNPELRKHLGSEIENPETDMVIFHAHGGEERQLLLGIPPASTLDDHVKEIQRILRGKLRRARKRGKNTDEIQRYYQDRYAFPPEWFSGAFSDSLLYEDSLFNAVMDFTVQDIKEMTPAPRVIYFDECFNGAFTNQDYIAGEYLFNSGQTVVAIANSVNVRQDIWSDELLGLLGFGVRIGEWHKNLPFLENHILGDPTFSFFPQGKSIFTEIEKNNPRIIRKLLKSPSPTLRVLGLKKVQRYDSKRAEKTFLKFYGSDPSINVRMEALNGLARLRSPEFESILFTAIHDPGELIRRISAVWMGRVGKQEYISDLMEAMLKDESERVRFQAKNALDLISPRLSLDFLLTFPDSNLVTSYQVRSFRRSEKWLFEELIPSIKDSSQEEKKWISSLRTFRAYPFQEALEEIIDVSLDENIPEEIKKQALETLGWYQLSVKREKVINACNSLLKRSTTPAIVRKEAAKTITRIRSGANYPIAP